MEDKFKQIKDSLMNHSISPRFFEDIYNNIASTLENYDFKDKKLCIDNLNDLLRIIKHNKDDYFRYIIVFNSLIESEYGCSVNKFFDSKITFFGNYKGIEFEQDIDINREKSNGKITKNFLNYFNFKNIIYIDSPSILEDNYQSSQYHSQMLSRKLKKIKNPDDIYDEELFKDLNGFKLSIDEMIGGKFEYNHLKDIFLFKKYDDVFSMDNTSSGLKLLGIIQLLLDNNELTKNSFLILDNPENYLHPHFQIKLAQILVLASKNLNITLYLNTHSPFLAEAIEVYSKYYGIYDQTNFYLTKESENKAKFDYILMDDMEIMVVYENLGNPFDTLNEIRFKTELRNDYVSI